jgi:two-component system response regulator YesN
MYKALLVDDEPYVIEGLKAMGDWDQYGFTVCGEAANGEDALERFCACQPDIIFTDIRMPALDGLELIKQVRENLSYQVKFVILSGYDEFDYIQYAMRYGVSDYLLKPIDDQELNTVLAESARRLDEENRKHELLQQRKILSAGNAVKRLLKGDSRATLVKQVKELWKLEDAVPLRFILIGLDQYGKWRDELDEREINRKKAEIKGLIAAGTAALARFGPLDMDDRRFGLIIAEQPPVDNQLGKALSKLQKKLHERQYSVSIGISEALPGPGATISADGCGARLSIFQGGRQSDLQS